MRKLKDFEFEVVLKNGKRNFAVISSKHLNGAVRKLYQMYDIEELIHIW